MRFTGELDLARMHRERRARLVDAMRAQGVKVLREPGTSPGGNQVSFVEGPEGVRIEVMQRGR